MTGLALVLAACQSSAGAQVEGVVQSIDTVSGQLTVKLKDGGVMTINFQDVPIETLRKALGTASLEPGRPVTIELDDNNRARRIRAHVAEVEGFIKSVDQDEKTVTIRSRGNREVTVKVTAATELEVEDGDGATFADLQPGQEVEAEYNVETKEALELEVEEEEGAEIEGTITAIDKGSKTITIRARNGIEDTFKVTPTTELELDGAGSFDELTTGTRVEAKFNPATKDLFKLEVED